MKKSVPQKSKPPSQLIDARIKELGDWRGKMLSRLRALVNETHKVASRLFMTTPKMTHFFTLSFPQN